MRKRLFLAVLMMFLATMWLVPALAERTACVLEQEGEEGTILVFPEPVNGPDWPVIGFTIFGVGEPPTLLVETTDGEEAGETTETFFKPDLRFSGWFRLPNSEIRAIWINDNYIHWEVCDD